MSMDYLYTLPDDNVPEDWKEGEHSWHSSFAIDCQERDIVYL